MGQGNVRQVVRWIQSPLEHCEMRFIVTGLAAVLLLGASCTRARRPKEEQRRSRSDISVDKAPPKLRSNGRARPRLPDVSSAKSRRLFTAGTNPDLLREALIPKGCFIMGETWKTGIHPDETYVRPRYRPHRICLDAYYIDKYEVTKARYAQCVSAMQCTAPTNGPGECLKYVAKWSDDLPVTCVTWRQAVAYCGWRNQRLPTEAEWEHAARGGNKRIYPWGNAAPDCSKTVMGYGKPGNVIPKLCAGNSPSKGGSRRKDLSPFGLYDLAGNVAEWTQDWHDAEYYAKSPISNPKGPSRGDEKVVRGGQFHDYRAVSFRLTERSGRQPKIPGVGIGFRCVRDRQSP